MYTVLSTTFSETNLSKLSKHLNLDHLFPVWICHMGLKLIIISFIDGTARWIDCFRLNIIR